MNTIEGFPNPPKGYYKVYVNTITYNQSRYIEDCLDGVLMQKTNFPFIHHVIDDCSLDSEQDVIKTWIEKKCDISTLENYDNDICTIIIAKAKDNPSYTIAAYFLKRNLWTKPREKEALYTIWQEVCTYEALCEGDDYWIHPMKLQQQVEVLDKDPSISMVYSDFQTVDYKNNPITRDYFENCKIISSKQPQFSTLLLQFNFICTPTVIIRIKCLDSIFIKKSPRLFDYSLFLSASVMGRMVYLDTQTAAYRQTPGSAMNSDSASVFNNWAYEVRLYFVCVWNKGFIPSNLINIYDSTCRDALITTLLDSRNKNRILHFFMLLVHYPSLIVDAGVLISKLICRKFLRIIK